MHSSRMRTVRNSSRLGGRTWSGGSTWSGGVPGPAGVPGREGVPFQVLPPPPLWKNKTFVADGNYWYARARQKFMMFLRGAVPNGIDLLRYICCYTLCTLFVPHCIACVMFTLQSFIK